MDLAGVALIIAEWIVQLTHSWDGRNDIQAWFLLAYVFGAALLVVGGFQKEPTDLAVLDLVSLVAVGLPIIRLRAAQKL